MVIGEAGHKINYIYNTQDATKKYYKCYMVMNNNNNNNNMVIKITYGTHNTRYNIKNYSKFSIICVYHIIQFVD
jgi:hypothetical protein